MSTSYYHLRRPVTSLHLREAEHDELSVWTDHGLSGTLTMPKGHGKLLARMLANTDAVPPLHVHYGGDSVGCVASESATGLDPSLILVSDCGEIVTVAEVRAMAGMGRRS